MFKTQGSSVDLGRDELFTSVNGALTGLQRARRFRRYNLSSHLPSQAPEPGAKRLFLRQLPNTFCYARNRRTNKFKVLSTLVLQLVGKLARCFRRPFLHFGESSVEGSQGNLKPRLGLNFPLPGRGVEFVER